MNADGTNEQQLTDTPSVSSDEQPSISPDGTKIVFASNQHYEEFGDPDGDQLDLYIMDAADGGNVRRLTSDASPTSPTNNLESRSQNPAWSPDGTRIAYESTRSGNSEIWVMNVDGTGLADHRCEPLGTRSRHRRRPGGLGSPQPDGRYGHGG
jgi:Tol biopolymer transport system component